MSKRDIRVNDFLADVIAVSKKHGMAIGHEDEHGAFIVHRSGDLNIYYEWLNQAYVQQPEE